jgi:DNA primase
MSLSQEIDARINIVDLVSRYVPLKKAGMNYKWLSPFVQEKTPSFVVSPAKNIAYCFSSHRGGGPIKFLMEVENIEYREAVQILAKEAGIELKTNFSKEKWANSEDIYGLYRKATEWYHNALFDPENKKALDYLLDRQISLDTIRKFQLWYSHNPRDMWYAMKEAGFSDTFLIESGIFLSSSRDKFFGRITFPIANYLGHVVGFTARVLDDGLPKYLNSPASKVFDKSSILYGLHLAKGEVAKTGNILIVEGQMDTITLHQAWVSIAVGISGTALTTEHIKILRRFTKRIYLALDSDKAWVNATFSSIESIANEDIDLRIIQIPNGKDPDEYLRSWGNMDSLFHDAISPLTFFLREGSRRYDMNSVVGKRQLIDDCLGFLTSITSHTELDMYLREIWSYMNVSSESLHADFLRIKRSKKSILTQIPEKFKEKTFATEKVDISLFDRMSVYIEKFDFFDLFFRNFRYTTEDLSWERNFILLTSTLSRSPLDDDVRERKILTELVVEQEVENLSEAQIQQTFLDMIRSLHKILFLRERDTLLLSLDTSSTEYLISKKNMDDRARALGLSPSILKE